jgi:mRNA interferase MazF
MGEKSGLQALDRADDANADETFPIGYRRAGEEQTDLGPPQPGTARPPRPADGRGGPSTLRPDRGRNRGTCPRREASGRRAGTDQPRNRRGLRTDPTDREGAGGCPRAHATDDRRRAVVSRGDVCWTELPNIGRRPAVILTRSEAIPTLHRVLVVPPTGTIRGIATEVRLGREDNLPTECVASLDNVQRAERALLGEPITCLCGLRMHEVCRAMAIAIGCAQAGGPRRNRFQTSQR